MTVNKDVKIKTIIIGTFLGIIIILSLAVGVIVFSNWYKLANRNGNLLASYVNNNIENEINRFLFVPHQINEHHNLYLSNHLLDTSQFLSNEGFFVDVLISHPDVFSVVFATAQGDLYGARVIDNNQYEVIRMDASTDGKYAIFDFDGEETSSSMIEEHEGFDPRTREWYVNAELNEGPVYSPMYRHYTNEFTFTRSWPVYNENQELIGVFATHISFEKLNAFLHHVIAPLEGIVVIFEKETHFMIANSLQTTYYTVEGSQIIRHRFQEHVSPNIEAAYTHYLETGNTEFKYTKIGSNIYFNVIEYNDGQLEWAVISAIPVSFFMQDVYRSLNYTIAIVLFIIFIATFIYLKFAKSLFQSLDDLSITAHHLAKGNLSVRAIKKRNDEVGILTDSINMMADNLDNMVNQLETLVEQRTDALKIANIEIKENQIKLKSILDSTAEGIYGIDHKGMCTFINQSAILLLGFNNEEDVIGKNMHELIHHHREDGRLFPIKDCPILKSVHHGESTHAKRDVFYKKDGSKLFVRYSSYPQYRDQELIGAVISFADNTIEKEREDSILYISYHDYLTGLYNRRYFVEELARLDHVDNYPLGLIMLDLNALKLFNDAFGHFKGDQALVKVARVLEKIIRGDGILCRLGGDEFAIVLPHSSEIEMHFLKQEIKNTIIRHDIEGVQISLAVGYELKYDSKSNLDEILKRAEDHMYKNKMSERLNVNNNAIMSILQTLFNKHPQEKKHAEEVSQYAKLLGRALELESDKIHDLSISALYHDIGKISIPDNVLSKPAALTSEEYEVVKQHAEIGYQILKAVDDYSEYAMHAYAHHENYDGSGYPRGLKEKEIPLFSRIISIANAYQNMTTDRTYRKAMSQDEAIAELKKNAGTQFDAKLVDVFIKKVIQ